MKEVLEAKKYKMFFALLATSGAGFVVAGGLILSAAACCAVVSFDLGEVAQKASHMAHQ